MKIKIPAPLKNLEKEGWIEEIPIINNQFYIFKALKSVALRKKWNEIKELLKNMGFEYDNSCGGWRCDVGKVKTPPK